MVSIKPDTLDLQHNASIEQTLVTKSVLLSSFGLAITKIVQSSAAKQLKEVAARQINVFKVTGPNLSIDQSNNMLTF